MKEKRIEYVSAKITDKKTLSALDFINEHAARKFNMSNSVRDAVHIAAAEMGWKFEEDIPFGSATGSNEI